MDDSMLDRPPDRRRAALILLAIIAVAVVIVASVFWATRNGSTNQAAPQPTFTPAPATSQPATTPVPSPTPHKAAKPSVPHDFVAAAAPSEFTFSGKAFTIKADVCGMENVRPLDPPGEQHHTVCWVQHDFGYAPGSKGKGTTYVLGHAWGQDPQEVLNKISETVTRNVLPEYTSGAPTKLSGVPIFPSTKLNGYVLTLRTPTGVLAYKVHDTYAVAKPQAGSITQLVDQNVKNRIVLITCSELNHVDYDYNIVVDAYLMSSKATESTT